MKRFAFLFPCALMILVGLASPASAAALSSEIDKVLQDKLLSRAKVGIDIVRLGKGPGDISQLFQSNPAMPLIPASNLKVVTTSAALQRLGADFKFRTLLLAHAGDLVLIGDGDPTLGDAELLKKVGWDVDTVFKTWAGGLAKRGLIGARDLLVDDSVFDDAFYHPNWPADQQQKHYMAEVAAVNLNDNCIDFYVRSASPGRIVNFATDPSTNYVTIKNGCIGGEDNAVWLCASPAPMTSSSAATPREANDVPIQVTIHDPPLYAGTVLAETLKSSGVALRGGVKRDRSARAAYAHAQETGDKSWILLALHETPLTSVIARANKDSINLYAECLCKRLGFAASGTSGTWENGTAAVSEFLAGLKIPPRSIFPGRRLRTFQAEHDQRPRDGHRSFARFLQPRLRRLAELPVGGG